MIRVLRTVASRWARRMTGPGPNWSLEPKGSMTPVDTGGREVLAFAPPDYLGVSQSTKRLFRRTVPLDPGDLLLPRDRIALEEAVIALGPDVIVFSGFAPGYARLARRLRSARPGCRILGLWHGTPLQLAEVEDRKQYQSLIGLLRDGVIDRVGFFKTGQGAAHAAQGLSACDVFNPPPNGPLRVVPGRESRDDLKYRLGLFFAGASWRKNPYAMLEAAARLDVDSISGVLDSLARAHAESIGLKLANVRETPFSSEMLDSLIGVQDCNLYVSLSECSPLFPLESLHRGVPCLVGPSSHLFAGSPVEGSDGLSVDSRVEEAAALLETRLVVGRPDDPRAIAEGITRAVADRKAIQEAYGHWVGAYDRAARSSVESFLDHSDGGRSKP